MMKLNLSEKLTVIFAGSVFVIITILTVFGK